MSKPSTILFVSSGDNFRNPQLFFALMCTVKAIFNFDDTKTESVWPKLMIIQEPDNDERPMLQQAQRKKGHDMKRVSSKLTYKIQHPHDPEIPTKIN